MRYDTKTRIVKRNSHFGAHKRVPDDPSGAKSVPKAAQDAPKFQGRVVSELLETLLGALGLAWGAQGDFLKKNQEFSRFFMRFWFLNLWILDIFAECMISKSKKRIFKIYKFTRGYV